MLKNHVIDKPKAIASRLLTTKTNRFCGDRPKHKARREFKNALDVRPQNWPCKFLPLCIAQKSVSSPRAHYATDMRYDSITLCISSDWCTRWTSFSRPQLEKHKEQMQEVRRAQLLWCVFRFGQIDRLRSVGLNDSGRREWQPVWLRTSEFVCVHMCVHSSFSLGGGVSSSLTERGRRREELRAKRYLLCLKCFVAVLHQDTFFPGALRVNASLIANKSIRVNNFHCESLAWNLCLFKSGGKLHSL